MPDGRQVTVIDPGQTRPVHASPGDHELYPRIRRQKSSQTLGLHESEGEVVWVRCGRPSTSFSGLLDLVRLRMPDREGVAPVEIVDL
jgi:hypothetical protein